MKDPAILFYTSDFLSGTAFFNDEQRGQYIKLLCEQHQNGHIPKEHMIEICKSYDSPVIKKFITDKSSLYFNERMEKEILRRVSYSESRRDNRIGSQKKEAKPTHDETHDKTYDSAMSTHMETGTRTDTLIDTVINYNGVLENFHLYCDKLPKVAKLSDERKKHISGRFKEFGFDKIVEVLKQAGCSDFLSGKNDRCWKADIDWIFNPTNFLKIMEGKYENKINGNKPKLSFSSKNLITNDTEIQ